MKFSIPYNGDKYFFDKLERSSLIKNVEEIYFAGNPMVMGSGRRPKIKDFIIQNGEKMEFDFISYDREISNLIKKSKENGIRCNLLMNFDAPLTYEAINYISGLIDEGISVATVGSIKVLKQVKNNWKEKLEIQNSVYIEIQTLDDVMKFVELGVSIFLLPVDMNDDLVMVKKVHELLSSYGNVKLKIMVNEGCIKYCPFRKQDQLDAQEYQIEKTIQDFVNNSEERRVLIQPCRSYMNLKGIGKTNFIHPKNIYLYEQFQPIIKIVGRSFDTERILTSIEAYMELKYEGDLREIIENFKHSQSPVYFNSQCNTNFLQKEG